MLERQNRAGHEVTVAPVIHQLRVVHPAAVLRVQATRVEPAPRRRVDRAGHVPRQDNALPPQPRMRDGHRREQCFGVRVLRIGEQLIGHRDLDDPAQVHDRDPVADVLDHRQVVGDEQVGQPELLLQLFQQVEHLRLDGHVQRGDGFIANDQLGVDCQCPGDADALPLPSGKLVRIAIHMVRRETDDLEQLLHPPYLLLAVGQVVDLQWLPDDVTHGHARVQRRVGILEDDLHVPAQPAQLLFGEFEDVPAFEERLTTGRLHQPQDHPAQCGLAAAGFAHQPQGLAPVNRQGDAVHRLDRADLALDDEPLRNGEMLDQVADV